MPAERLAGTEAGGNWEQFTRSDAPLLSLRLWPHRSLGRSGATSVLAVLTIGLAVPLVPLLGTTAGWGLLPFLALALIGLYLALRRSYDDGLLTEDLRLWPDLIAVERVEPRGPIRRWHANPYWVEARLFDTERIEKYLTLRGNGREIELGAFLTPDERAELYENLKLALSGVRNGGQSAIPVDP